MDLELLEHLLHEPESQSLDFKQAQYRFERASELDKSELLKDMLAFANSWRRTPAYVLIGVREVKGGPSQVIGITDHIEDASVKGGGKTYHWVSTVSESVLTNWPAEMSYSRYGEYDFESKRTGKTSGPEQFAR